MCLQSLVYSLSSHWLMMLFMYICFDWLFKFILGLRRSYFNILMVLQPSFLHTDFNKWRDEDDSEEEDRGADDDFEAVSYSQPRSSLPPQIL